MNLESTIDLGIHFELKTKNKIFSPSPATYGVEANTEANVTDWAVPGVLPRLNKDVYRPGIMVALATHPHISPVTYFDHKNYFYLGNPKAHQITQFFQPLARDGYTEVEVRGKKKRISIHEMHIEENAGKNTHGVNGYSYVDLSRQGAPLLEIVSGPDVEDPEKACAYLTRLRQIVQFTGVSDVEMEGGSMRVDTNISIRPTGQEKLGIRVEMKNLNSFDHVRRSLTYEEKRQQQILLSGGKVQLSTRHFNETTSKTILEHVKEGDADYRYFPEPDTVPYHIKQGWIDEIAESLSESPFEHHKRHVEEYSIKEYDADVILQAKESNDFYGAAVAAGADPTLAANWLNTQVNDYLSESQVDIANIKLTPEHLAEMIKMIEGGTISSKITKKVFKEPIENGTDPKKYVGDKGMVRLSDVSVLGPMVTKVADDNPQSVEDFKSGKGRTIGLLVDRIMEQTRGKANPKIVNQLLSKEPQSR